MEISDSELLMLVSEKNEEAEEILNERYKKVIVYYIKKYQNKLIELDININDLFNSCFEIYELAIVNYIDSSDASFKTYASLLIERKIKKTIVKKIQDNKKINFVNFSDLPYLENSILKYGNIDDPLEVICEDEQKNKLKEILYKNFEYKDIYMLYLYADGLSIKSIADIFSIPYDNLSKKIKRMKLKISEEYLKMNVDSSML